MCRRSHSSRALWCAMQSPMPVPGRGFSPLHRLSAEARRPPAVPPSHDTWCAHGRSPDVGPRDARAVSHGDPSAVLPPPPPFAE